jgi:hypothetical protein
MKWNKVTIEANMRLFEALGKEYENETSKTLGVLSALHNKPEDYFLSIDIKTLIKEAKGVNDLIATQLCSKFPSVIKANGKRYFLEMQPSKIPHATQQRIKELSEDSVKNYHLIIAELVYPVDFFGRNLFARMFEKARTAEQIDVAFNEVRKQRLQIAEDLKATLTMDKVFSISEYYEKMQRKLFDATIKVLQDTQKKATKKVTKELNELLRESKTN